MTVPASRVRATLALTVAVALGVAACGPSDARDPAPSEAAAATAPPTLASSSPTPATTEPTPAATPAASTVAPTPSATQAPTPAATPTATPTPAPTEFAITLAHRTDFVAQYTFEWCVGASLQMALNIIGDERDTTRARQADLWDLARDHSFSPFGGANSRGWATALNELGVGPYELTSYESFEAAVTAAARALRVTGKPVGLPMWRGRHAWVLTGFESVGDPAIHADFRVTRVRVMDPLYPHGSSVWGRSPKPNSLISLDTLGAQYVRRVNRPSYDLGVASGWLLIEPTA